MLLCFNARAQGASHIEKNVPCQDASAARFDENNIVGMAFVADGHGGSKYFRSDKGSFLAVKVAEKAISDFYGKIASEKAAFFNFKVNNEEIKGREILDSLKLLEGNIIYNWRNEVLLHLSNNPLSEAEKEICTKNRLDFSDDNNLIILYGTTLLASLISASFWFSMQIGDGLCVVIENDEDSIFPIPEDDRLAFGRTTSLCDTDAIQNFREAYGLNSIKGITVATDGVADSFEPDKYIEFTKGLYDKFIQFPVKAEEELKEFLPELSERGSRDDVSIAGVFKVNEMDKHNNES